MKKVKLICDYCNSEFERLEKEAKRKKNKVYCSLKCAGKVNNKHFDKWRISKENKLNLKMYNIKKSKHKNKFNEILRRCENRKKHKFNIDVKYIEELWNNQKGKCAYTNVNLILPEHNNKYNNYNYLASIDRINSNKGYIKGNVQFVSVSVNWLKNKNSNNHIFEFFDIIKSCKDGEA